MGDCGGGEVGELGNAGRGLGNRFRQFTTTLGESIRRHTCGWFVPPENRQPRCGRPGWTFRVSTSSIRFCTSAPGSRPAAVSRATSATIRYGQFQSKRMPHCSATTCGEAEVGPAAPELDTALRQVARVVESMGFLMLRFSSAAVVHRFLKRGPCHFRNYRATSW